MKRNYLLLKIRKNKKIKIEKRGDYNFERKEKI